MEVFLRGVPATLAEDNLKAALAPFVNALGIADWVVDKPKRKPMAWVTFLNAADGTKFLKTHGQLKAAPLPDQGQLSSNGKSRAPTDQSQQSSNSQQKAAAAAAAPPPPPPPGQRQPSSSSSTKPRLPVAGARYIARLHLLSTPICAERSKRAVNALAINHLSHERDERQRKPDRGSQRAPEISCSVTHVSCGKMVFGQEDMGLKYIQQIQHPIRGGYVKFGLRSVTVHHEGVGRMDMPVHTIQELVLDHKSRGIIFILEDPPKFFAQQTSQGGDGGSRWERQTSFPSWAAHAKYVAHCLVYRLTLAGDYSATARAIRRQDILAISHNNVPLTSSPMPIVEDYPTGLKVFEGKLQSLGDVGSGLVPFAILFQVQSLVWNNYLHPYGGLGVLDMIERTAKDPAWKSSTPPFTVDAMKRSQHSIPYPVTGTDSSEVDPRAFIENVTREEAHLRSQDAARSGVYGPRLPRHQTWVFKAMVAPTRISLQGPDAEARNRVLRMFPDHGDYFLRVSFCDEDGQDLSFNPKVSNDAVFERFREVLLGGIRIAGRLFSFLGFSHSSLRSHSAWFLAPFLAADGQRQSRDTILAALGDFGEIRVPAKCAARIGQAFSETPFAVDLFATGISVRYVPDVKSADGSRVFSDGVGSISPGAAEELWKALPRRAAGSTCFQIRWAGFKGLLVLDARLRGRVIRVRKESMMKFPSRDLRELGICDVGSRPLRLVLNRQVIKILEDMGTDDGWFMALQDDALDLLRGVTATALNTSTFLRYQDVGGSIGLTSFIKQLDKMGIDYRRDTFLKSVVEHVVLRELRLLKYRARIPVPKGVTLFGVMDETGFLKEGEVYIAHDATRGKSGERLDGTLADGPVIVTRSPALHPGDVQAALMVTPPPSHPLRQLRNCVVFSQKGSRDLPSQLSGGDLDGDLYNVIWDPRASPPVTFEPADYARVTPPSLDRPVTRHDIANFFIDFMKSDILGLIATRHQILADVHADGTSDADCVRLAEMHSTAVDYSKTGIAVDWREMPRPPRSRPDFLAPAPPVHLYDLGEISHILDDDDGDGDDMGLTKPRYHRSDKILGRLYRGVDEKKIWSEDIHRTVPTGGPSVWDQLKGRVRAELAARGIATHYSLYHAEARKIRMLYEDSVGDNMWHFSENPRRRISEAEVFCGSVLNRQGIQSRKQREASMRLKEETDRHMAWIAKLIHDGITKKKTEEGGAGAVAYHDYDSGDDDDDDDDDDESDGDGEEYDALRLAWACLVVGCAKTKVEPGRDEEEEEEGEEELQSFRVVAAACLLRELGDR
ncbi:RNA-dependent RNA polymerase [Cordyceps fumosorosea ARSEF 2679]|uniref:RNA-dependent RNA polymerase n=1 Tax=Cordyceps fumosorosea (strain ARSEF 2679) TaxID=1081104 RepID=A0A167NCT2_CORFA|nr:RNA-dependent RNA polymerase [Cordyceps fumosorosea ARSEF 2679]OAA55404.1 RNA-dependent RNA polymerase [Cordyceps fumosorosea ARSEF 2679]